MLAYRAISKKEFAEDAEISLSTLQKWLHQFRHELSALQSPNAKILLPATVKLLSEHYCVMPHNAHEI